jgi:hypothetical protein
MRPPTTACAILALVTLALGCSHRQDDSLRKGLEKLPRADSAARADTAAPAAQAAGPLPAGIADTVGFPGAGRPANEPAAGAQPSASPAAPDTGAPTPPLLKGSPPPPNDTRPWIPANPPRIGPASDGSWTTGATDVTHSLSGSSTLTEVRAAANGEFDRVVFTFDGAIPGYHVAYDEGPLHQCGSGRRLEVGGRAWLVIRMAPANAHTESGAPTVAERDRRPELPVLRALRQTCDFEGHVEWVAGLYERKPYRVLELHDPERLVVDVKR